MGSTDTQQASPMHAAPQKEHQWLEKLVGEWTFEGETPAASGQAPVKYTGTERFRSLGGLWFVGESESEMPGDEPARMIITLGYDPQKQSYVGTWIGSMMTNMFVYTGEVDPSERMLTLHTEGPDMATVGKTAEYKEVIEFKSDDERVFTSYVQGDDGQWQQLMTTSYRRAK